LSVASAVAKAEVPLKRSNKLLDSLWVTMKNTVRWQLTSSALHGFVGALETAYGYTKDLDRSLNEIRIVSGKSASDMSEFAEQANKAAKALSTTTTDYTDASLIYYQQGLSDQEVLDRTETTIKMANVAGTTAETASQQLTAIWNNFYDGSESLEHYADVMVKLGAATASSSDEISKGIEKFASIGNTVGLSYEYAASALATVTAQTRESASVVGTAFRTLFSRIQGLQQGDTLEDGTTLNKYSQALATVGVQIKDTNGNLKGMDEILDDLGSKWGTLAQDQKIALAETVAGVRQWTQLIALMDNWDFFKDNLALAQNADGTLTEQAEIYAESWQGARDRVKAAAEDIYDSLINPQFFVDVDDNITPLLTGIADVIDAMGGMKGIILTTGTVFTAVYHD
jgi:TP901 family phage tail tape measure protein